MTSRANPGSASEWTEYKNARAEWYSKLENLNKELENGENENKIRMYKMVRKKLETFEKKDAAGLFNRPGATDEAKKYRDELNNLYREYPTLRYPELKPGQRKALQNAEGLKPVLQQVLQQKRYVDGRSDALKNTEYLAMSLTSNTECRL